MAHHWRVDAWGNHDGAAGDLLGAILYWPLGLESIDMTEAQFLILVGTLWVVPHVPARVGLLGGNLILIAACLKGMGWI